MNRRERASAPTPELLSVSSKPTATSSLPIAPKPRSKAFNVILDRVERYAEDDSIRIVFEGESGTGKNWLARLAHQRSRRASRVFHERSLTTVPDALAPSELFGHVQGAFTDARHRRSGAFQSANHGTLFLDEIGKATPEVQRLLLRAIEEGVIYAVGSDVPIRVDARLIFATNVNLQALKGKGLFLADLYARLGYFRIEVPPLRERREDIPDLAKYFLALHAARRGYPPGLPTIHPALMAALEEAKWEDNLRGLDGAMHLLLVEAQSASELTFEHCHFCLEYLRKHKRGRPRKASRTQIADAVSRNGTIAGAARALGIARSTVHRQLARTNTGQSPPPVAV